MPSHSDTLYLYGGDHPWDESEWESTDDRVRGGSSISHLKVSSPDSACFHGNLDTSTLGGAGFASQQTKGTNHWDLSQYDGILITLGSGSGSRGDGKRYVVTLKDEIPGRRHDGRRRSGISWEATFDNKDQQQTDDRQHGTGHSALGPREVWLPWESFKATYRGRPKEDAKPLDLCSVKRVGLMMRSFFDEQHGDFELELRSIAALEKPAGAGSTATATSTNGIGGQGSQGMAESDSDSDSHDEEDADSLQKPARCASTSAGATSRHTERHSSGRGSSWWRGVFCGLL